MIYRYVSEWEQDDPLNTEYKEMIVSWGNSRLSMDYCGSVSFRWRVCQPYMYFLYYVGLCVDKLNTGLVKKNLVSQNNTLRNVHLIWFLNSSTRSVFWETILINWIDEFNWILLKLMLWKITLKQSTNMCWAIISPLLKKISFGA